MDSRPVLELYLRTASLLLGTSSIRLMTDLVPIAILLAEKMIRLQ